MKKASLTVVLFQEGSQWVAQSLEKDFAVQGNDLPDALESLAYLLRADTAVRQTNEPDAAPPPVAPKYYFNMFPKIEVAVLAVERFPIRIPHNNPLPLPTKEPIFTDEFRRIIEEGIRDGAIHLVTEEDAIRMLKDLLPLFKAHFGLSTIEEIDAAIVAGKLPCQQEASLVEKWIDISAMLPEDPTVSSRLKQRIEGTE